MTHRQPPSESAAAHAEARLALDAYGADPARWPTQAQPLFDAARGDTAFEAARADAAALDAALDKARAPRAGEALEAAILASYDIAPRMAGGGFLAAFGLRDGVGFRRFIPAGALAGLSAIGFVVGAATAGAGSAMADDFLLYSEASLTVAYDEGDALWAEE